MIKSNKEELGAILVGGHSIEGYRQECNRKEMQREKQEREEKERKQKQLQDSTEKRVYTSRSQNIFFMSKISSTFVR